MNKELILKQIELLSSLVDKSLEEQAEIEKSLKLKKESVKEYQEQINKLIKELK